MGVSHLHHARCARGAAEHLKLNDAFKRGASFGQLQLGIVDLLCYIESTLIATNNLNEIHSKTVQMVQAPTTNSHRLECRLLRYLRYIY